jgi:serine protease
MKTSSAKRVIVIVIALLFLFGAAIPAVSQGEVRVLIEYKPGQGAMIRNTVLAAGGQIHHEFDRINAIAVTVTEHWFNRLAADPNVLTIEPDAKRYPAADPLPVADPSVEQVMPYGIERVQAPQAWAEGATGAGVTVCIIDTGLYWEHEDIDENYVIGGTSQDPNSDWDSDGYGHGTHVAGTITAMDNELGVIGVSPGKVSLFIVKVFGEDGLWTTASDLMAAAFTCADNGANIISMSLSGSSGPGPERKAFDELYKQGILSVAAASNDGTRQRVFPASYDSVISVAATDIDNNIADFSNQNKWVELAAPGVGVLSTVPYIPDSWLYVGEEAYQGNPMEFSPYGTATGALADGGLCLASGDWSEQVVLCERGDISFAEKVTNVQDGGGIAAVIYNNAPGLFSGTLGEEGDWIVAISISQEDGQAALAYLGQEATVQSAPPIPGSSYEAWNGTSMATPHVSGVAALLWSAYPEMTNSQIRAAMTMTALDLGEPGRDIAFGYGLVQAYDALQYLLNLKPGQGPSGPK